LYLRNWDFTLKPGSVPASIYAEWENQLRFAYMESEIPTKLMSFQGEPLYYPQMKLVMDWFLYKADKAAVAEKSLKASLMSLEKRLGKDMQTWRYGQKKNKHVQISHPLSSAVNDSLRKIFEAGPVARGGNSLTVNNTSYGLNQRSGASFRFISDTENWDNCLGMNSPGQSGDIRSPFYKNLFNLWVNDRFFPVYYSAKKIQEVSKEHRTLIPK
ncbi:MAG: penicillin acylase family protein, partial [Bacteroidota bacterium]